MSNGKPVNLAEQAHVWETSFFNKFIISFIKTRTNMFPYQIVIEFQKIFLEFQLHRF